MITMMESRRMDGPFCRDCGVAVFREMTADTLLKGWYAAYSLFATPATVLVNVVRRRKVTRLDPPRPPGHGPSRRPMDPGDPLIARPAAVLGPLPALLFVAVIVGILVNAST
jgi:hypothetical protein